MLISCSQGFDLGSLKEESSLMDIRFACNLCHRKLIIASNLAGSYVSCPQCKSKIQVPDGSTPEMNGKPVVSKFSVSATKEMESMRKELFDVRTTLDQK